MKKLDNKTFDPPEEFKLKCVISSIKQYAEDYSLTASQIEGIFHEGVLASSKAGKIHIPSYSDDDLPIMGK
jgi:hypothetical protein